MSEVPSEKTFSAAGGQGASPEVLRAAFKKCLWDRRVAQDDTATDEEVLSELSPILKRWNPNPTAGKDQAVVRTVFLRFLPVMASTTELAALMRVYDVLKPRPANVLDPGLCVCWTSWSTWIKGAAAELLISQGIRIWDAKGEKLTSTISWKIAEMDTNGVPQDKGNDKRIALERLKANKAVVIGGGGGGAQWDAFSAEITKRPRFTKEEQVLALGDVARLVVASYILDDIVRPVLRTPEVATAGEWFLLGYRCGRRSVRSQRAVQQDVVLGS